MIWNFVKSLNEIKKKDAFSIYLIQLGSLSKNREKLSLTRLEFEKPLLGLIVIE